jgi:GH15 family glucan-1,4-alpha-glucosidase
MGGARAAQALHAIKADGLAGLRYRPPLAERFGLDARVVRWKQVRQEIHDEVCAKGYDPERNTFTQYYGSKELDAAALAVVLLAFLPGSDQRVTGTINAVRDGLGHDGFISRYSTAETDDRVARQRGRVPRLLVLARRRLGLNGRLDEARALFERPPGLTNDHGLLSEEYDVGRQRQVGTNPQAFSHPALINAAATITAAT